MRYATVLLAIGLTGCATPTYQEQQAKQSQLAERCVSLGYRPNTPEFDSCKAQVAADNSKISTYGVGAVAAGAAFLAGMLSDARLKDGVTHVATFPNGIKLYRFHYRGQTQEYVGVLAQEVREIVPDAVLYGDHGYFYVDYGKLGFRMMTVDEWQKSFLKLVLKKDPCPE